MRSNRLASFLLVLATSAPLARVSGGFEVDWVNVFGAGNPGLNRCTVYACPETVGRVLYDFRMARTEVSNSQYAEFLNAVAADDTNGLYDPLMGDAVTSQGGIVQSGDPGSYAYAPIQGREDMPVNHVSFAEAVRFANWLHNGQPAGAQDATTTEDGAYTITPTNLIDLSFTRNLDALVFVPTQDEWIKAGYYDPTSTSYFVYPTSTNVEPPCSAPTATPNRQNCGNVAGDLTPVGSFPGSASPFGTFDQAGNVFEWTERRFGISRFMHGGSFAQSPDLASSAGGIPAIPSSKISWIGFRVASVIPEPGLGAMIVAGVLGLAGLRQRKGRAA